MKNTSIFSFLVLILLSSVIVFTSFTYPEKEENTRENTPGTVTFTVKTKTQGGNFAPKHVLAIWVEHEGEFVKTRKAMANQRKQYLYTWKAVSNYNVTDAITGATLTSHQTHTVEWDCTDLDGNVVPDGNYTMRIEFTEKHAQGPLFSIDFEKGTEAIALTPPDEQNFIDMEFSYDPEIVMIADFTADVQEACTGETIVFTDNSTGATSWDWDFGNGANPATANTQGPHEVSYETEGSKTVSLTIDQGITQTKQDYINVFPDAVAGYTWTQQSRTITFANTSESADSYQWDFGDGNTSTDENPVHTFVEDGSYEVSLVAVSEMCANDEHMEEIVINTVGISTPEEMNNIRIYPNPGNGIFNFIAPKDSQNSTIEIYDTKGQLVYSRLYATVSKGELLSFGDNQLNAGMYILNWNSDNSSMVQKLLVK